MKKTLILLAAFAACALSSCVKEQDVNETVTVFSARQMDMSTKTVIGAAEDGRYQPLWTSSDKVKVNGVASTATEILNDGMAANFTLEGEFQAPYYAVSPANACNKFDAVERKLTLLVYGTGVPQKYEEHEENVTYSANSALMAAYGESNELVFHHLMAYYKLTVNGGEANIKTIYVRQAGENENIAGAWTLQYDENGDYDFAPSSLTSVIAYDCGTEGVEPGKPVMVAVPAYDFENGLILTVKDMNGKFQSYGIPASAAALAGKEGAVITKELTFAPQSGTINSAEDWEAFAAAVNSGNDWDLYRWVGNGTVTIGKSFEITNPTRITGKNGKFPYNVDGGKNTITVKDGTSALFRSVRGQIRNLTIAGNIVSSSRNVASFADSLLAGGSLVNCVNEAALSSANTGDQYGGGIVRVLYGGGSIENCHNKGTITLTPDCSSAFANCYVGGIIGQICQTESVTISNCSNNAAITVKPTISSTSYNITCAGIGGIAGWVRNGNYNVTFDNCDNLSEGDITISAENISEAAEKSAVCVGGIVGIAANYNAQYHALGTPNASNGMDITLSNCDNSGDIRNDAYSNANLSSSNVKVYTGGLAGALIGKEADRAQVTGCTVSNCYLIPYDVVDGSDRAGYCGVVGGMIGFGGYVDIEKCESSPIIGTGKRQSVSFAGVLGFAMKPFSIKDSKIWAEGYFNRLQSYTNNRAVAAVVPKYYYDPSSKTNKAMSPAGDVSGSSISNCQIGGLLKTSGSTYDDTHTEDLSGNCTASLFTTSGNAASNMVLGQNYTQNQAKENGVTFSDLSGWVR